MRNRLLVGTLALSLSLLLAHPAGAVIAVGGANDQDQNQQMKAMSSPKKPAAPPAVEAPAPAAPAMQQPAPAPMAPRTQVVRLERVLRLGGNLRRGMHGQQSFRVIGRTAYGRTVLEVNATTGGTGALIDRQPVTNAMALNWIRQADPSALSAGDRQALGQAIYYLEH